jgi:uncharacterized BrkB/YihY/UPF0761 family membrane protein
VVPEGTWRPRDGWLRFIAALVGSLGLLAGLFFAVAIAGFAAMGTAYCDTTPEEVLCDDRGWLVATRAPVISAAAGCLIGLTGAWIWPRRRRWLWLAAGYFVTVVGFVVVDAWLDRISDRL